MNTKLKSFLQLIRVPNLWTIPADIFLGFFLVLPAGQFALSPLIGLILISSLIYSSGLILNDLMDYDEDRLDRPNRPLPSGDITLTEARTAYIIMNLVAVGLSWFVSETAFVLSVLIIFSVYLYNGPSRAKKSWGFVQMGACRSLNVLLGASLFIDQWSFILLVVAIAEGAYIWAVTALAYEETRALPSRSLVLRSFWVCSALSLILLIVLPWSIWLLPVLVGFLIYLFSLLKPILQSDFPLAKLPPKIGQLIRFLIVFSATVIILVRPEYCLVSILLIASLPLAQWTSKRFYSS